MDLLKKFYQEEEGMGTVEIVMIIGVLIAIALLFKEKLTRYATSVMEKAFSQEYDPG